jgi:hypothetical protein
VSSRVYTTKEALRKRDARRTLVGFALGATAALALGLYSSQGEHVATAGTGHTAVSPSLIRIAEWVCRKNDGLKELVVHAGRAGVFSFVCRDGARFEDVVARVDMRADSY